MRKNAVDRRALLTATTALGAATLLPRGARPQDRAAAALPARDELVRATDPNMAPIGDPYDALVQLARPTNVDTVVVDGRILRRGGQFTALDHATTLRDAMDSLAGLKARAKWPG